MQEAPIFTIQQYQEACNLTESPIDDVSRERWKKAWKPSIALLSCVAGDLLRRRVDALKKWAAYGKIPDDLQLIGDTSNGHNYGISFIADNNTYRLLHAVLGMASELEEILCCFVQAGSNKREFSLDVANFGEELGDFFWYAGLACNATGLSLQKILEVNHEKLMLRYQKRMAGENVVGSSRDATTNRIFADPATVGFTEEAAINRDLPAERAVLEAGTTAVASVSYQQPANDAVEAALVAETRRTHCPDCKTALKHINSRVGPFSYCPKCEPEDGEEEELVAVPDPSAFCTYCDIHGHDRSACPQLAPAYAAPLMIEPLDGDEEPLTPPDSNPAPKGARPQIRTQDTHRFSSTNPPISQPGRFQQDGGFAGFRQ